MVRETDGPLLVLNGYFDRLLALSFSLRRLPDLPDRSLTGSFEQSSMKIHPNAGYLSNFVAPSLALKLLALKSCYWYRIA